MPNAIQGLLAPEMRATPRKNKLMGLLADALTAANDYAQRPDATMPGGKANPVLGLLADAVALPSMATTAQRVSYGEPLTNGLRGSKAFLKPETADVAMMAPISPRNALAALGMVGGMADNGAMRAAQPVGTWFKGMHPHDWTKETRTFEGPLLDPKDIKRTTPFPTYGGEVESLDGVRGFFSSDPEVASRFSRLSKRGAVYPVNLDYSKPYVIDAGGKKAAEIQFGKGGADFQRAVSSGKYDAVIIKNTADEGDVAVLLDGGNVRSVWDR